MGVSISHWPGPPTSWWWYFTGTPILSRCWTISRAQVVELVLGRDGVVAAVQRDVMPVPAGALFQSASLQLQAVGGVVDAVVEAHVVEDVELELGSPEAAVGDAGGAQILFGADGDIARVVGEDLVRIGFQRECR